MGILGLSTENRDFLRGATCNPGHAWLTISRFLENDRYLQQASKTGLRVDFPHQGTRDFRDYSVCSTMIL
jgi:hypothetical protein